MPISERKYSHVMLRTAIAVARRHAHVAPIDKFVAVYGHGILGLRYSTRCVERFDDAFAERREGSDKTLLAIVRTYGRDAYENRVDLHDRLPVLWQARAVEIDELMPVRVAIANQQYATLSAQKTALRAMRVIVNDSYGDKRSTLYHWQSIVSDDYERDVFLLRRDEYVFAVVSAGAVLFYQEAKTALSLLSIARLMQSQVDSPAR